MRRKGSQRGMMKQGKLPWSQIEFVCIDAGNTLFGMDLERICDLLAAEGVATDREELERAEMAARPEVSRFRLEDPQAGISGFQVYFRATLGGLAAAHTLPNQELDRISQRLAPILDGPGKKRLLWTRVLPGVPEALRALRDDGLRLVVVSNSDGTVEKKIERYGFRAYFDRVVDSAVVGVRKPDPVIFDYALRGFGIAPERAIHVGDSYASDVLGAQRAGLHAVLLDPGGHWVDWPCTRLPTFLDLARKLIDARNG